MFTLHPQMFGGWNRRYTYDSKELGCKTTFTVFYPPAAESHSVPVRSPAYSSSMHAACACRRPASSPVGAAPCQIIYYLSGLTCTDENVIQKCGIQRKAAELGVAIVAPDTSPRGLNVYACMQLLLLPHEESWHAALRHGLHIAASILSIITCAAPTPDREGESDSWDFGVGAGFYLNATQPKWRNWRMYDYITKELPGALKGLPLDVDNVRPPLWPRDASRLVRRSRHATHMAAMQLLTKGNAHTSLPLSQALASGNCVLFKRLLEAQPCMHAQAAVMGHSMGGHGALVLGLRNPQLYKSISAFAPIANPSAVPWGEKAFSGYLGGDRAAGKQYDATELARSSIPRLLPCCREAVHTTAVKAWSPPSCLICMASCPQQTLPRCQPDVLCKCVSRFLVAYVAPCR